MTLISFVLLKLKQILASSYECVLPKLHKFTVFHFSLEKNNMPN